jgi:O-antigen biosynthesis protein
MIPEASLPMVTCLCITRNRREWLPRAIECFRSQSYANRELLIVADGADVSDLVPSDPAIRLVCVGARLSIGDKRNYACALARGEIIAHWDDDDFSAPGRVLDQVGRLLSTSKAVTGYRTMRFTDGRQWWLYEGDPAFVVGASLSYRKAWWSEHPFASVQVGEDNGFVAAAASKGQLASGGPAGELMHASIHAANTSPRQTSAANWTRLELAS